MPQATDLTLKNGAATPLNKIFNLISPAAGYGGVAEWALKEGAISSVFPRLTALARSGASASGRAPTKVLQFKVRVPSSYTDTVTGQTNVASAFEANLTVSVPADYPEALKNDAVAFMSTFIASSLVKAMVVDGAPAT